MIQPLVILTVALSFLHILMARRVGRRSQNFTSLPPARETPSSRVTVLVPSRNEERNIEACVRSLLDQAYDNYSVLVIDDSEDATPQILERLAKSDQRLKVIKPPPLPGGWVGKSWQLAVGAKESQGEWFLFTDADTIHEPGMLPTVIAYAESQQLDMLSLLPRPTLLSFWERAILPAVFAIIVMTRGSAQEVSDPESREARANGQFILIRREVYKAIGGHAAVRSELLEDQALAKLIKRHGYRIGLVAGWDVVQVRMYQSLGEIWEGFSKNAFLAVERSLTRIAVGAAVVFGLLVAPFVLFAAALGMLVSGDRSTWVWLLLTLSGLQSGHVLYNGKRATMLMRIPGRYAALFPFGALVFVGILLNSAFLIISRRGVTWKGRRYLSTTNQS